MAVPRDEHERTLAFAEIALGQIRALSQPASPRNFEIWYNYATGYNPALNRAHQPDARAKGHAQRSRSRPDLQHLHRHEPHRRTDRHGRLARARRDQASAGDDRRRRRLGDELFREPRRRLREARRRQRRRHAARRDRAPDGGRQGDGAQQQEARSAVCRPRSRRSSSSSKISRPCAPKALPIRSPAVEPQVLRCRARQGHRRRRGEERAAVAA